jgi:hypothetical protein
MVRTPAEMNARPGSGQQARVGSAWTSASPGVWRSPPPSGPGSAHRSALCRRSPRPRSAREQARCAAPAARPCMPADGH